MKKKIKSLFLIFILIIILIGESLLIFGNINFLFKKSSHAEAKRISNKHCLVFYPNSSYGKQKAKALLCKSQEDLIYDYSLAKYGDYYLVDYGDGYSYFVDQNYNEVIIGEINDKAKKIISDYLRYTIKKEKPEIYYSLSFLNESYVENLNFDDVSYEIDNLDLKCYFSQYDLAVYVPLKYLQESLKMNFGYEDVVYQKPVYIDDEHPAICLTFDDGPNFWDDNESSSSKKIVETLYKYDACATFYCVGECLENNDFWTDFQIYTFLNNSIEQGNEYGSHCENHYDTLLNCDSSQEIKKMINGPVDFFKENFNYEIKTYRPPEGAFDEDVLAAQDIPAILWCIDSCDWESRDEKQIYDKVLSYEIVEGDIIIFHDIYDETASAIEKLVPELISRGYQLVTVADMLAHENINIATLKYYYNFIPAYYE